MTTRPTTTRPTTTFIFANGDIAETEWLRPLLSQASRIIAADGGTRHLYALNRLPDIVIGDMDSLPDPLRHWLAAASIQPIIHPHAKDETDLELALLYARQYREPIWIFGALGGRLDQTLANVWLLAHPALAGHEVALVTEFERAWLVEKGETAVHGQPGDLVSLIPMGGDVVIRATTGLAWPLQAERLVFGPARGVSNVMQADIATIIVDDGRLLCVHMQQGWAR
jgi:thiamine pyrophosphokinase